MTHPLNEAMAFAAKVEAMLRRGEITQAQYDQMLEDETNRYKRKTATMKSLTVIKN